MIADVIFLSFLISIGWVLHSLVNTNYKKRWKTATALLEEPPTAPLLAPEGEWKLERYIKQATWVEGKAKGTEFQGIAYRAVNGTQIVQIKPNTNQFAVDPSEEDVEIRLNKYRRKAETVVKELNRGIATDKSPFSKPEPAEEY